MIIRHIPLLRVEVVDHPLMHAMHITSKALDRVVEQFKIKADAGAPYPPLSIVQDGVSRNAGTIIAMYRQGDSVFADFEVSEEDAAMIREQISAKGRDRLATSFVDVEPPSVDRVEIALPEPSVVVNAVKEKEQK